MKTKLIILLFLIGMSSYAQNIVYASFSPVDLGTGLRLDHIQGKGGTYMAISFGEYKWYDNSYIKDHVKVAMGYVQAVDRVFISYGVCLHKYGETNVPELKKVVTYPLSFEIGCATHFKNISFAVRFDPVKVESSLDLGFRF